MKILCAPDSLKETLSAAEAAAAMARGIKRALPNAACDECPIGDGGEGTLDAMVTALGGKFHQAVALNSLGKSVATKFGKCSIGLGIVELAQVSGLMLIPHAQRDPMRTSTFGTGQLVRAAIEAGCREILICIGGSATVDGGTGLAQALGAKFFDRDGHLMMEPMTGGRLLQISRIEPAQNLPPIRVACDVNNPLLGPNGAARVYGPQKGASAQQVTELEAGLAHLSSVVGGDPTVPGAGAAGGAGFGLAALCGATLEPGIDLVLKTVRFDERCRAAQLVLTAEGQLDSQSLQGKACIGVAKAAAKLGVPTIAIVGSTSEGAEDCIDPKKDGPLKRYFSLADRFGLENALSQPAELISQAAEAIVTDPSIILGAS